MLYFGTQFHRMAEQYAKPGHIFTTYLAISAIILTPDSNHVFLLGVYGNMLNGDVETIEFECGFGLLNDLLPLVDEQAEEAIEALSTHIANPTGEHHTIDLSESGGLHFEGYAFALQVIHEQDENGRPYLPDVPSYHLAGYIPQPSFVPDGLGYPLPRDGAELVQYYNRLLALQYAFYQVFQKTMDEETARVRANLFDPLVRELARVVYEQEVDSDGYGEGQ